MQAGFVKRTVAGTLAGVAAGTLVAGTLLAQAPTGGAAPAATAVDSLYGVWALTPECRLEDVVLVLGPRMMLDTSATRNARVSVTYEPAQDGVVMTAVRSLTARNGSWEQGPTSDIGSSVVFQRRESSLVAIRVVERDGRARAPSREDIPILHACR